MKILLFGTGEYYQKYKKWFDKENIVALLDNDKDKQGNYIDDIIVMSPNKIEDVEYDIVVILSFFVKEMKEQLLSKGVREEQIYHFYDIKKLIEEGYLKEKSFPIMEYDVESEEKKNSKNILLLSQDLERIGPNSALLKLSSILKGLNYNLTLGVMCDGPMRQDFLNAGVKIVVDNNLQVAYMNEINWIMKYKTVLCNTLNFHIFLMHRNTDARIIWWLHDPLYFYEGARKENFCKINREGLEIYTVGIIPENAIKQYMPDIDCNRLLYFVEDCQLRSVPKDDEIVFTIIGYINNIKGQDVLIDAINKTSPDIIDKCKFIFVGNDQTAAAKHIKQKCNGKSKLIFTGVVDKDTVQQELDKTDVLVCPSRLDAMPTVCVEAMVKEIPCVVSDITGIAEYIIDYDNGIRFKSENVEDLSQKIKWCVENKNRLKTMGEKSRIIYDENFAESVFRQNIDRIFNDRLGD